MQLSLSAVQPIPPPAHQCQVLCKGAEVCTNGKSAVYDVVRRKV
jgi:hypothetical protein